MKPSELPALRKFWYCVGPSGALKDKPISVRILDEPIALWRDKSGAPRAVKDRCLHRTARLSLGSVEDGNIVCPYHGWRFDGAGHCVKVPQDVPEKPNPFGVTGYFCKEQYNHLWVALEEPIRDVPHISEFYAEGYRQVIEFSELWNANPLRIIENSFDAAHITFVHAASFGSPDPTVPPFTIEDEEDGFTVYSDIEVRNADHMKAALSMNDDTTRRSGGNHYIAPFSRIGRINYPNGLENILCTFITPCNDTSALFNQFVMRNDTEQQVPAEKVIAFDRQITNEDREVLESTDLNVPLDTSEGSELHMISDRPGMQMRKILRGLRTTATV
jgi:phenylpropionate dioxygenase-like ring-hydroxylating dioxygenase large terminal subunit